VGEVGELLADGDDDLTDPFSPGSGLDLFEAAHARLESLGLRVPEVHLTDRDRAHYPADLAILEDFPGGDLLDLLNRDPQAAEPTMARLADALAAMASHRGPSFGKVGLIDAGGVSRGTSCAQAALDFGLYCLAEAAERDQRIAGARDRLEERLHEFAAAGAAACRVRGRPWRAGAGPRAGGPGRESRSDRHRVDGIHLNVRLEEARA
jgi:hypothetical protein